MKKSRLIRNILKWPCRISGIFLLILIGIVLLPYSLSPYYRFPAARPFQGDCWFNPYENLTGKWIQCNFHMHSRSWAGTTDGRDLPCDMYAVYRDLGYDAVSISNYQSIIKEKPDFCDYIPAYEHGFNASKCHRIAIGAKKVTWLDYLLWMNVHHKQHLINHIRSQTDVLLLAHPNMRNSYTTDEMTRLTGYTAVEALNHYTFSLDKWDTALSAGRPVWVMGNDDCHNISEDGQTGVRWTMIHAGAPDRASLMEALQRGRMTAAAGFRAVNNNSLQAVTIENNQLNIVCSRTADSVRFIGYGGKIKSVLYRTGRASCPLLQSDSYIRTEIYTDRHALYLNPVLRYDGEKLQGPAARILWVPTWIKRILVWGAAGALLLMAGLSRRKK